MKKYWFTTRKYGYGFSANTWQGWFTLISFIGLIIISSYMNNFAYDIRTPEGFRRFFDIFIIICLFFALFRHKIDGELKWRWGESNAERIHKLYLKNLKKDFLKKFGKENGDKYIEQFESAYQELHKNTPPLAEGVSVIWKSQMAMTANMLAVYKIYKTNKLGTPSDAWDSCNYMIRGALRSIPDFLKKIMNKSGFSKKSIDGFKKDAEIMEKNPCGDVIDFYGCGSTGKYDYEMDIKECAKMKYIKKLGYEEFAPYICQVDRIIAEEMGFCLVRTKTIADGGKICDFKMKREGKANITSPVWEKRWDKEDFQAQKK